MGCFVEDHPTSRTDLESEEDCVATTSTAASFPEDVAFTSDIDSWRLPEMAPYETYTMVAIVALTQVHNSRPEVLV